MKTIKTIASKAAAISKIRAKNKGLKYDIDPQYLLSIFPKDGLCPILNIRFDFRKSLMGKGNAHKYAPSLDRINPRLGYTRGNVQWVSHLANLMMSEADGDDLCKFAKWIIKRYNLNNKGEKNGKKYKLHKTHGMQQLRLV